MLNISDELYAALKHQSEKDAFARLPEFVEARYPALAVRYFEGGLEDHLQDLVRSAAGFGISSAEGVYGFVDLCCLCGQGFPHRPDDLWARSILEDRGAAEADRIARCHAMTMADVSTEPPPPSAVPSRPGSPFLPELDG